MSLKIYLEEKASDYLYHVTHTKKVPLIKKKGLLGMQTSNWVKAGDMSRYGSGEIYAFEHPADAVQWAAKMDWAFDPKEMGKGNISIVRIKKSKGWEIDENDPISQAGKKGNWLKIKRKIFPNEIIDSVPITLEITKKLVKGEDLTNLF